MCEKYHKSIDEIAEIFVKVSGDLEAMKNYMEGKRVTEWSLLEDLSLTKDESTNDFGKARQLKNEEEDLTTSIQGTYTFLPPECCSFETDIYSMKKADIWALGMTLYCMTFNRFPFSLGNTEMQLMENICNHELTFEDREISTELKLFFEEIL